MLENELDPRIVRMPELAVGEWLNVKRPLTRDQLRGKVILIDFWDYTCVNCIRTLPYLTRWHARYAAKGLIIIGVHAPEFKFGQALSQIEAAIAEHHIHYPVLLDNQYETWSRFANKAWPTKFLIDSAGYIRLKRQGEGHYQAVEQAIQTLLQQNTPDISLPDLLPPLREEDKSGAVCYRPTPELYAGYQGGGIFGAGLGNPEGFVTDDTLAYVLPKADARQEGRFYVSGLWRAWPEALAFVGQVSGQIYLKYSAVGVNAVFSPSVDLGRGRATVEVRQNGRFLTPHNAGADIQFDGNGRSTLTITRPRMFSIVQNSDFETHELTLAVVTPDVALYAFTFTSCVTA